LLVEAPPEGVWRQRALRAQQLAEALRHARSPSESSGV
jgi:hypothetical protein